MHSTDDQLKEIMRRAETVKETRSRKKQLRASALASGICAALLIAVCIFLPGLSFTQDGATPQQYGSLLLKTPYMGYIVVGVIAFVLGICITLLCINWKLLRQRDPERK